MLHEDNLTEYQNLLLHLERWGQESTQYFDSSIFDVEQLKKHFYDGIRLYGRLFESMGSLRGVNDDLFKAYNILAYSLMASLVGLFGLIYGVNYIRPPVTSYFLTLNGEEG